MRRLERLFAFLLLVLPLCSAAQGVRTMTEVEPDSRSLILRATHIVAVRVVSADDPKWAPASVGEERTVSLQLALEEIFKGRLKQRPGDALRIQAKQRRVGMSWRPLPGVWSNVPLAPGTRLVAFSRMDGEDAAAALNDPAAIQLLPAAEALADVQLVAKVASRGMNLRALLAEAAPVDASLGWIFADYLWAKFQREAIADFAAFNSIMDFMERRSLNGIARATLLMSVPDAVLAPEPPPAAQVDRLAVAMFRLLEMPEAAALHDNIVGTYLPNLLNLGEPNAARAASAVFKNYPQDRTRAMRTLSASKQASAAPLLAWLRR